MTRGSLFRRTALTGALGLAVVAALAAPAAEAAPAAPSAAAPAAATADVQSVALAKALGAKSVGSYVDSAGKLVVNVTDQASAAAVRASGATPKLVAHSAAQLAGVQASFLTAPAVVGSAWGLDPVTNQVVLSLPAGAKGAAVSALKAAAARAGSAARSRR